MIQAHLVKTRITNHEGNIQNFAELFVQDIIEEALKLSSINIHFSQNSGINQQFSSVKQKNSNSIHQSTPQPSYSIFGNSRRAPKISFQTTKNFSCEDLYTLPVDSVKYQKFKKSSSLEEKCLKPKAVHALNVIKAPPRTLIDLKYLLLNLYSSKVAPTRKLGSENSAFTKYQCQNVASGQRIAPLESTRRKQTDYPHIRQMKTETDMKNARKCNRVKRCTFLNIKNSVFSVFQSHKQMEDQLSKQNLNPLQDRSLPPLPLSVRCSCENYSNPPEQSVNNEQFEDENNAYDADVEFNHGNYTDGYVKRNQAYHFASSIEKVKDYGWYWGPMSSESAEKLLANEKHGAFIVRDSSDDRYIFSLTFKLNSSIMHVRIEHGQGNFSFGNHTNFRSHTIVEFIENTMQHSKSGRYLFFQYRHPTEGPMEVQLLYPVSRFKRVQSLQHMCRFVIRKSVRRDLIPSLPLPRPLIEYLSSKDYYAEEKF